MQCGRGSGVGSGSRPVFPRSWWYLLPLLYYAQPTLPLAQVVRPTCHNIYLPALENEHIVIVIELSFVINVYYLYELLLTIYIVVALIHHTTKAFVKSKVLAPKVSNLNVREKIVIPFVES